VPRVGGSFYIWPYAPARTNWCFGIAGKDNKVSVACYRRLDQIASDLQGKYELHPVNWPAGRLECGMVIDQGPHSRFYIPPRAKLLTGKLAGINSGLTGMPN
jgi:hypothetical protein